MRSIKVSQCILLLRSKNPRKVPRVTSLSQLSWEKYLLDMVNLLGEVGQVRSKGNQEEEEERRREEEGGGHRQSEKREREGRCCW
jgi:hypothetical protein